MVSALLGSSLLGQHHGQAVKHKINNIKMSIKRTDQSLEHQNPKIPILNFMSRDLKTILGSLD